MSSMGSLVAWAFAEGSVVVSTMGVQSDNRYFRFGDGQSKESFLSAWRESAERRNLFVFEGTAGEYSTEEAFSAPDALDLPPTAEVIY